MKMRSISFRLINIAELDTEIIVNSANTDLEASGGVCGSIFHAAGYDQIQNACAHIGHCDIGQAVITRGYQLKAKYVVHAVGPIWQGGDYQEPELLYSCYWESLRLAVQYDCHSIAIPLISTGIYGVPKDIAWVMALQACIDFLKENMDYDLDIVFAVLEEEVLEMGRETLQKMAPEYEKTE